MKEKLFIVTPTYFDSKSLLRLREAAAQAIDPDRFNVAWVIIDDSAGIDREFKQLQWDSSVKVITPPFNLGPQRAITYGLRLISSSVGQSDWVLTLDSDGEDDPKYIPQMIEKMMASDAGLVLAKRTSRRESLTFRGLYWCYKKVFRVLTGSVIQSGSYALMRGLYISTRLHHPYFDLCYNSSLVALSPDLVYFPCPRSARYFGKSKMGYRGVFIHSFRSLMPFTDRIVLRLSLLFSGVFLISCFGAILIVLIRLFTTYAIPGWASLTVFSLIGVSFIALGNAAIIFLLTAQSNSFSLRGLEEEMNGSF